MSALRSKRLLPTLRRAGPYLLIELFLPGGTLLALLLWLSQGMARGKFAILHRPDLTPPAVELVVAAKAPQRAPFGHRCFA
jgi:hypothetical protein